MKRFVSDLKLHWHERPFVWDEGSYGLGSRLPPPSGARVLALAPHPDDPESAAVTCRLLMGSGCQIRYAILTPSPVGVEDAYARDWHHDDSLTLQEKKVEIRRREQLRAAEMLGLSSERISFLGLEEDETGSVADSRANRDMIRQHLEATTPDIVIMPVGSDTNHTHAWVFQIFRKLADHLVQEHGKPVVAFYNEDPKTTRIRADLLVPFGEQSADWKGALLQAHDSQQQRNINTRDIGFDERILDMNRQGFRHLIDSCGRETPSQGYTEVFELELFDFP